MQKMRDKFTNKYKVQSNFGLRKLDCIKLIVIIIVSIIVVIIELKNMWLYFILRLQ